MTEQARTKARKKIAPHPPEQPPPKVAKITNKQAAILTFIDDGCREDALNRSASLRKIAARFGFSRTAAWKHIEALKRQKCITGEPDMAYSLELTDLGRSTAEVWRHNGSDAFTKDEQDGYDG